MLALSPLLYQVHAMIKLEREGLSWIVDLGVSGQSVGCSEEAYSGREDLVKQTNSLQGQMQNHKGTEVPLSFKAHHQ